jgi:hypothetical protein
MFYLGLISDSCTSETIVVVTTVQLYKTVTTTGALFRRFISLSFHKNESEIKKLLMSVSLQPHFICAVGT